MTYCPYCGTQQYDDAAFCHSCGKKAGAAANAAPQPASPTLNVAVAAVPAPEVKFYDSESVSVTNTRFIMPGQTYAIANVTSVRLEKVEPSYKGAGWCIFLGLAFGIVGLAGSGAIAVGILGLILLAIGIAWATSLKPDYAVTLCTAGGEKRAIVARDADYVRGIVEALNKAIVYRN